MRSSLCLTEPITAAICFYTLDIMLILQVLNKMDALLMLFFTKIQKLVGSIQTLVQGRTRFAIGLSPFPNFLPQ